MDSSKLRVSNGSGEAVRALVTGLRTPGSTVININTSVNWPTGDFVATAGPLLSDGTLDPAKMLVFRAHIVGSTLVIDALAPGYVDTYGNSVGDVVVIKPNTWWADTVAAAAESMNTFVLEQGDWRAIGTTVSSVVNNGNRSYTATLAADKSAILSPGMRLRTTRTTAAPTQSTSLNGTNQYWSKTSPAGMTFPDDFVTGAWVKLSSYPAADVGLISRYNGTSGWILTIKNTGQLALQGYNGSSANYSAVVSYQSIPLNKWVHVTAQLDMSAFTATTTTSYTMIDGVDVPASVSRGGTAPTSLIQAGNLEVGSFNGGVSPFPGKIAQVAIFSAKVTQATIRSYISQGLTGSETSLVSAYSFNGVATDLNTTNANNLTAMNGATATNADSPFGGQANGTISSTKDYAIIQRVAGTSVTFQVAEGCTVPTTGTVSFEYSTMKSPYGFPGQREKWILRVQLVASSAISNATSVAGLWSVIMNTGFTVPVGTWNLTHRALWTASSSTATTTKIQIQLDTGTVSRGRENQGVYFPSNGASYQTGLLEGSEIFNFDIPTTVNLYGATSNATGTPALYTENFGVSPLITAENTYL